MLAALRRDAKVSTPASTYTARPALGHPYRQVWAQEDALRARARATGAPLPVVTGQPVPDTFGPVTQRLVAVSAPTRVSTPGL